MKFYLLPLVAAAALTAAHTVSADEALFKSKPCIACHSVDAKLVGPSLKEVAEKYADDEGAVEMLAGHIKDGSSGVWGPIPMPPNAVTEEEATKLAEWIMTL